MKKESYQEVPPPEEITQKVEEIKSGNLSGQSTTESEAEEPWLSSAKQAQEKERGKKWEFMERESLTNLRGEIDSILSFKLIGKTRAEELEIIYQRLLQKRGHTRDSDRKFERAADEGASAYLEEKIEAVEKEMDIKKEA